MASKKKRRKSAANGRRKGSQGERDAADLLGGQRINDVGRRSADVIDPYGDLWEVKRRGSKFSEIYGFVAQNRDMTQGKVIMRDDRKEWLVVMPLDTWLQHRKDQHD